MDGPDRSIANRAETADVESRVSQKNTDVSPTGTQIMSTTKQLYHRVDEWARNLSRLRYATLVGVISLSSYLLVGALLGESVTIEAFTMGLTLAILFYAFNPNQQK